MDVLTYDPNILFLDLGDERMSAKQDVEAYGTSEGVKKEWESRSRKSPRPLPEADPPAPDEGQFEAIRTDDGAIYWGKDTSGSTHYSLARAKGIPPERIVGGGWITNGVYNESDQSDSKRLGDRARANIRIGKYLDLQAEALWHGIPIEGFSSHGEEMIRSAISRVPPELLQNVHCVKAAPELQPKHGRYDPETHTVNINPLIFNLMQRFGKGQGWIYHTELCVVHEIGHSIYYFLPEKEKDEWRDISGWMIGTQEGQASAYDETRPGWPHGKSKWTHRKGIGFTRKYAKKNDDEDFADSFAFYILSKPFQMEPAKREFIDKLIKERVKKYPTVAVDGPVKAYGTREGLEKAWDTRGRGRHPKFTPKTIDELIPERPSFPKMDQPSKEPGYVGPMEEFYHGTISENLASILKKGLVQDEKQKFKMWDIERMGPMTTKTNGFVYLTKDKHLAEWYAELKQKYANAKKGDNIRMRYMDEALGAKPSITFQKMVDEPNLSGAKPAVITLEVPMSEEKNFREDDASMPGQAWMAKGKIPAKYLGEIEVFNGSAWKPWWTKAQGRIGAERTVPVYLVFYGPTAHIALVLDTKS